jgi:hypothetical protein
MRARHIIDEPGPAQTHDRIASGKARQKKVGEGGMERI